ncbi:MAG: flagellum-specific ATP synthase FliI, partial [Acutalibacteraceae bacterium]
DIISVYNQNEDLISIGAYKPGMNLKLDEAINKIDAVNNFLKQEIGTNFSFEETLEMMKVI